MNRRKVLTTLGTLSIATVAGCSSGDGGRNDAPTDTPTDTPTDSPTPSPTPTATTLNEQALKHYQSAVEVLVEIREVLDRWAENSVNNMEEVKELQDKVATARDDLDAAEENADPDGELSAQIQQARLVADFQELSLAYYEGVLVLLQKLSDGNTFADNEQHQRAADAFADARKLTDDIQSVIDDMETIFDELDTDTLDEPRLEYTGEPFDHLDGKGRKQVSGFGSYLKGREHIHLAFVQLEEGQKFMDAEEFSQGREAWETGRSHVETAKSAFNAAIDNDQTPREQRNASFDFLKIANGLLDAFDKFVAGAKEAEAGNTDNARTLIEEGYDILGETFEE